MPSWLPLLSFSVWIQGLNFRLISTANSEKFQARCSLMCPSFSLDSLTWNRLPQSIHSKPPVQCISIDRMACDFLGTIRSCLLLLTKPNPDWPAARVRCFIFLTHSMLFAYPQFFNVCLPVWALLSLSKDHELLKGGWSLGNTAPSYSV